MCHTFLVFTRNFFFLFLSFSYTLICFAQSTSALFDARLAPHYFTFPKQKGQCHSRQGLCLGNLISFIFNYWFYAHGLAQPLTGSLCSAPAMLAVVPCPFLFSQDISWLTSPWSPWLLPSFINNECFFSGLFYQLFSSIHCSQAEIHLLPLARCPNKFKKI